VQEATLPTIRFRHLKALSSHDDNETRHGRSNSDAVVARAVGVGEATVFRFVARLDRTIHTIRFQRQFVIGRSPLDGHGLGKPLDSSIRRSEHTGVDRSIQTARTALKRTDLQSPHCKFLGCTSRSSDLEVVPKPRNADRLEIGRSQVRPIQSSERTNFQIALSGSANKD
jgi:hypothetical protein